ncbi:MAG: DUF3822 family protein [Candidatus Azobacteroides sp.]|nr:DUF3822 family protein [Candidatus Azobacteroides sp.]
MRTILPEDRNIKHPDRTILTIYTGAEYFSFSLYDPEETGSYFYKELIGENHFDAFSVFKEAFFKRDFFSLPFRKVWIMNHTPNFTFVPGSIYKDQYREDFIRFLFSDQQGIILNRSLSSAGITILHQLPETVYQFMLHSFTEPEFIHYSAPVITYFLKTSKKVNARQMIVNLHEKGLDIFCFSKETFLLGNYFPCKGLSEALYYILFTWKQLQMDQLDDCLLITGNIAFKEELIGKLALYVQQIRFPTIPPEIYFEGVETDRIPFELATLSLCEL